MVQLRPARLLEQLGFLTSHRGRGCFFLWVAAQELVSKALSACDGGGVATGDSALLHRLQDFSTALSIVGVAAAVWSFWAWAFTGASPCRAED